MTHLLKANWEDELNETARKYHYKIVWISYSSEDHLYHIDVIDKLNDSFLHFCVHEEEADNFYKCLRDTRKKLKDNAPKEIKSCYTY